MNRNSRDRRRARLDKLEQRRLLGMERPGKKKPRQDSILPGFESRLLFDNPAKRPGKAESR